MQKLIDTTIETTINTHMYIKRNIQKQLNKLKTGFPVIAVTGPRQSGKTTPLQNSFPSYEYFNLELPQTRQLIKKDPVMFFKTHPKNIIMDEVQRLPELLSHIQVHVDETQKMGSILLSGSQNLLISEQISQSLAGRAAYLTLHPLSISELKKTNLLENTYPKQLFTHSQHACRKSHVTIRNS